MRKISILLPNLNGGGAERVNLDLAHEFVRKGYEVEFVLMHEEGVLLFEAKSNFSVVSLNISRLRQVPIALIKYLNKNKPDILLVSMWPLTVLSILGKLFSFHNCKIILSEHGILSAQYKKWGIFYQFILRFSTFFGYRFADSCVAVSSGVGLDMALIARLNKDRINIIHNPVVSTQSVGVEALDQVKELWGSYNIRILSVGRFKEVKNHKLLLHSFAELLRKIPAKLIILGEGELRDELESLVKDLNISQNVLLPGFYEDPTPFYLTATQFVLSSNYEGFGNVIVEALACGLPIVSTNCSGPAEILENGKFGILVPVNNEYELVQAMTRAIDIKYNPDELRMRARDFTPEIAALRYIELFK